MDGFRDVLSEDVITEAKARRWMESPESLERMLLIYHFDSVYGDSQKSGVRPNLLLYAALHGFGKCLKIVSEIHKLGGNVWTKTLSDFASIGIRKGLSVLHFATAWSTKEMVG